MSNTYYHYHHIKPRHMGGTDDSNNLIKLTVSEHAAWHYELWVYYGFKEDYIAWKTLSGQVTMSESKRMLQDIGRERGRRNRKGIPLTEEQKQKFRKPKSEQGKLNMRVPKPNNLGDKNGRAKTIVYNGIPYTTLKECREANGFSYWKMYCIAKQ